MKGWHAQKNLCAVGAMAPTPLSLKTRGGGGLGVVAYKDRARLPPRGRDPCQRRGLDATGAGMLQL